MPKHFRTLLPRIFVIACLLLALNLPVFAQAKPIRDLQPTVILVSLDGVRYDYLHLYQPMNLNSLMERWSAERSDAQRRVSKRRRSTPPFDRDPDLEGKLRSYTVERDC